MNKRGTKWVLDRFEGETYEKAVLENMETRETASFARETLPPGTSEGDVLRQTEEGCFTIDGAGTVARQASVRARFNRLKQKHENK
jgi:peptide deformylase